MAGGLLRRIRRPAAQETGNQGHGRVTGKGHEVKLTLGPERGREPGRTAWRPSLTVDGAASYARPIGKEDLRWDSLFQNVNDVFGWPKFVPVIPNRTSKRDALPRTRRPSENERMKG